MLDADKNLYVNYILRSKYNHWFTPQYITILFNEKMITQTGKHFSLGSSVKTLLIILMLKISTIKDFILLYIILSIANLSSSCKVLLWKRTIVIVFPKKNLDLPYLFVGLFLFEIFFVSSGSRLSSGNISNKSTCCLHDGYRWWHKEGK